MQLPAVAMTKVCPPLPYSAGTAARSAPACLAASSLSLRLDREHRPTMEYLKPDRQASKPPLFIVTNTQQNSSMIEKNNKIHKLIIALMFNIRYFL